MSPNEFQGLIARVTARIASRPLDAELEAWLNADYAAGSTGYTELASACRTGVQEGWLAGREGGGIRYGRIFKALPDTHGFSVDVVQMNNIAGPHHVHPNGEIDLIMPLTEGATFDGHAAGWCVYGQAVHIGRPWPAAARSCFICCPRGLSNSRSTRLDQVRRLNQLPPRAFEWLSY